MTSRARVLGAVVAVVTVAVVAFAVSMQQLAPTRADVVEQVESTLRCPTCPATSIADSQAPLAIDMRAEVRRQAARGEGVDDILQWFTARYGTEVLLSPPAEGFTVLVWVLPGLVLVAGVLGWLLSRRRRTGTLVDSPSTRQPPAPLPEDRPTSSRAPTPAGGSAPVLATAAAMGAVIAVVLAVAGNSSTASESTASAPAVSPSGPEGARPTGPEANGASVDQTIEALESAAERSPGQVEVWLALGRARDEQGELGEAAAAFRRAVRLRPDDPTPRFLLAFTLVRADRPQRAATLLHEVLADDPRHPEALLLLGTLQWRDDDPRARRTLRSFLRVAPDHEAASRVRGLLRGEGGS